MKNKILVIIVAILLFSCVVDKKDEVINQELIISDTNRAAITGLTSPTVSYILEKDGGDYLEEIDIELIESDGNYVMNFDLIAGADYIFTEFTIKAEDVIEYILDPDVEDNSTGFNLSLDGVLSVSPKVYLRKVTGVVYDELTYENFAVEIITDESSIMDPVSLTFQVSSNITDAVFKIYKYTIYWVSGPIINQNQTFDMDTGKLFDPMVEGDEDPWGSGKFKIETTNSLGETVFVVGFSEEWDKKHIHLILD